METVDHYSTLGVTRDTDPAVITAAYRALSRKLHPDVEGGDEARFALVNAAHDVLRDAGRRADYDITLADTQPAQPDATAPADAEPDDDWGEVVDDSNDEYAEIIEPDALADLPHDKPANNPRRRPPTAMLATAAVVTITAIVLTALVGSTPGWLWLIAVSIAAISVAATRATVASLVTAAAVVGLAWCVRDVSSSLAIAASWTTWSLPVVALIATIATSPREE